jgi:hypothetical protein
MASKLMEFFKKDPGAENNHSAQQKQALSKPVTVKSAEILAALAEARPNALRGIPEKQALALVSAVMGALGSRIDAAGDTPVRVAGLGVFRFREVEREIAGEVKRVRSIGFRRLPAAPRKAPGA